MSINTSIRNIIFEEEEIDNNPEEILLFLLSTIEEISKYVNKKDKFYGELSNIKNYIESIYNRQ
jgi:hypothetical protein